VSDLVDVAEYCRRVEDHLTRVNAGHLVRIVGPGFELVRGWAEAGVPLSVVFRGIELKAERHREGASTRPLRIEFCAGDVRAIFERWRRAVGLPGITWSDTHEHGPEEAASTEEASPKKKSLGRHFDRVIDRLSRAAGRVDFPEGLREHCARLLETLASLREASVRVRGDARDDVIARLTALDAELAEAVQQQAPPEMMKAARADAVSDLAPFRARLEPSAWNRSVVVTTDRLLRDRFGLPMLDP
jgi:hypothetical protein